LASIAGLRNLKTLYLTGCPLTDTAIPHLRNLKQLEALDVEGTQISASGLQSLKSSLPKLR
jgi:Leucine-rich repeat (LRR) protein